MSEFSSGNTPKIEMIYLTNFNGISVDISGMFKVLNIYEDIFYPVLTGNIDIEDFGGIFENLPIIGNETITIKFCSWDYSDVNRPCNFLHRTFDILNVTNITQKNDRTKTFTLHFASPELKKNETIEISKSWQDTTLSNVVKQVMIGDYEADKGLSFPENGANEVILRSPFLGPGGTECAFENVNDKDSAELFIEMTKYTEPYVTVPFMKPFDIINMMAARSIRKTSGRYGTLDTAEAANFVFFENKRGFQFVSIETLLEGKGLEGLSELRYGDAHSSLDPFLIAKNRSLGIDTIEVLKVQNCYDVIGKIKDGMYASEIQTYDFLTGQVTTTVFDYVESFYKSETTERDDSNLSSVSDWPQLTLDAENSNPVSEKPGSKHIFLPLNPTRGLDCITGEPTQRINEVKTFSGPEEYVQKRLSQLSRINNFVLKAQIQGNSKHKVGDVVKVDIREQVVNDVSSKAEESSDVPSKYYAGNYLITFIHHALSLTDYKMTLELSKDSFRSEIGRK